jgi:hypothetical protein
MVTQHKFLIQQDILRVSHAVLLLHTASLSNVRSKPATEVMLDIGRVSVIVSMTNSKVAFLIQRMGVSLLGVPVNAVSRKGVRCV